MSDFFEGIIVRLMIYLPDFICEACFGIEDTEEGEEKHRINLLGMVVFSVIIAAVVIIIAFIVNSNAEFKFVH